MSDGDELGDRMKVYEKSYDYKLDDMFPVIARCDGRAFHTFTRGAEKPFSGMVEEMMNYVAQALCEEVMNCKFSYVQSDEISLLLWKNNVSSHDWFGNRIQKLCSVISSIATTAATRFFVENDYELKNKYPNFDCRVFNVPHAEVVNYYWWRQKDWIRNSISMFARSHFSHNQLMNKQSDEVKGMLRELGHPWEDLPHNRKYGRCVIKAQRKVNVSNEHFEGEVERKFWEIDNEPPMFFENREYVEMRLTPEDK